ncbi:Hep_Hag repeat-containing protein [Methylobacterium radiotolerans JCM 2831]|uniref:Hep_Hag repeat-containing protein n=3 Tax=Methylobacterium radiotolerans TaxID=31998 RepID=B1M3V1_METRJ|nr:Hep_Hag repeat-containing protein [Methylobacterium radiotolerans JCM 2831]GAN48338.1 hypothetical protein ME121_2355 [Methylobacterium sp. ME121]GEM96895.1 hypothetical protein MRA01_14350 [Methylobacterium radiotolerans]
MRPLTVVPAVPRTAMLSAIRPGAARAIPIAAGLLLCTALATPARAQLLRGTLDTTTNGILGTGLTIGTSSPGSGVLGTGLNVGTTTGGSVLGTGVTVGTTAPGSGVLGTGLNVGTTGGGVLGTGVLVGTTGPGDGLLGTGLTLGTAGGTGTGGCGTCGGGGGTGGGGTGGGGTGGGGTGGGSNQGIYIITGNVTQSQGQTVINELRLSQLTSVTGVAANNTSNQAAPIAVGSDALAVGYGSSAAGTASTAVGTGASAANTGSVALGYAASAQGLGGTAIGTASAASGAGSTALGFVAGATGTGSTAVGAAASAAGNNSVALGNGAAANQANTIAIGANVKTTQANQVAIGNSANTYRLAGIASQASAAAQSGATAFVTTDANGNLAASAYGPSTIAGLGNRIDSVQAQVNNLEAKTDSVQRYAIQTRKEARQGVAMAIAMATAPMPSAPGKTTWATNGATYRGEWAGGLAVAHRLPTCCVPIAVTAGVAYGGDNAVGVRAGLAGEF